MRAVGWAFAWEFWTRSRLSAVLTLGYLLALVLLVNLMPAGRLDPEWIGGLLVPLAPVAVALVALFCYGEQDLMPRETTYPRRLLTLPLQTAALVGWPMAIGATVLALFWLVLATMVLRAGAVPVPVPLWWPAVFLAALGVWTQALMWLPYPLPALRLPVLLTVLGGGFGAAVLAYAGNVSPALLLAVSAGLIPPAYLVAVAGLSRARRGDVPVWHWPTWGRRTTLAAPRPPFAAAAAAQFWYEWRRNGLALPLLFGAYVLPLPLLLTYFRREDQPAWLPALAFLGTVVLFPPFLAAMVGVSLGSLHPRFPVSSVIPTFLATRPLTAAEFLAVKVRVAARTTLVTWGMAFLATLFLWPLTPVGATLAGWARQLVEAHGVRGAAWLLLGTLALVALSGKAIVDHLWLGLTGKGGFILTVIGAGMSVLVAMGFGVGWVVRHPEVHDVLLDAVPWIVGLALALKLGAGLLVARALWRRGLVETRTLARFTALWLGGATVLLGLAWWLMPPLVVSPLVVTGIAVLLLLPMVRLGLAPLALEWNRHR